MTSGVAPPARAAALAGVVGTSSLSCYDLWTRMHPFAHDWLRDLGWGLVSLVLVLAFRYWVVGSAAPIASTAWFRANLLEPAARESLKRLFAKPSPARNVLVFLLSSIVTMYVWEAVSRAL